MQYIAFNLTDACRKHVLSCVQPKYEQIFCEHITHIYGVDRILDAPRIDALMPKKPLSLFAYAYSCDDIGVEALLVSIDGITHRPDGKPYHLTVSLAADRRQSDSNLVIEKFGSVALVQIIELDADPFWND